MAAQGTQSLEASPLSAPPNVESSPKFFAPRDSEPALALLDEGVVEQQRQTTQQLADYPPHSPQDAPTPAQPFLNESQQHRLNTLLEHTYTVTAQQLPTLSIQAKEFVARIHRTLLARGVVVQDVFLNGSAATFVVSDNDSVVYNDLDFLFQLELPALHEIQNVFEAIRTTVFGCLLEYFPPELLPADPVVDLFFLQGYAQKLFKVPNKFVPDLEATDVWSLITLNCDQDLGDRHLEFKFVMKLRRTYEFSIDSLQISLLNALADVPEPAPLMSLYGELDEVLAHLRCREIHTRNVELVRGGGLLKYCYLLAQGYRCPYPDAERAKLERYMCNRFLVDYSNMAAMNMTLHNYFLIRLRRQPLLRALALDRLRDVAQRSQVGERAGLCAVIDALIATLPPARPHFVPLGFLDAHLPPHRPPPPPHASIMPVSLHVAHVSPAYFLPLAQPLPGPMLPLAPPAGIHVSDHDTESTSSGVDLSMPLLDPPMLQPLAQHAHPNPPAPAAASAASTAHPTPAPPSSLVASSFEQLSLEQRSAPASPTRHNFSKSRPKQAGVPQPNSLSPRRMNMSNGRRNSSDSLRELAGPNTHSYSRSGRDITVNFESLITAPRKPKKEAKDRA